MSDNNQKTAISTNELEARMQKTENIRARDGVVWKDKFERTHTIAAARGLGETIPDINTTGAMDHPDPSTTPTQKRDRDTAIMKLAGRVTALRWLGKLMFGRIYDIDGEIQFSMSREELGEDNYKFFKANVDMGDFVGLTGDLYRTTAGELTLRVTAYDILSKALRPLPEKFHGLADVETRYRQRYLDIIANEDTRRTMRMRFQMLRFIRNFLENNGFVEVETPIMQNVASGAAARPFVTHHNALDADFYLRIAPELFLKECIAAGFDRVFEIGKNFRNEGMDAMHLQEFTMLEWYAAYWDYNDNIDFSWKMIQGILMTLRGTLQIEYQGTTLDFSSYEKIDYTKRMNELLGVDILTYTDADVLLGKLLTEKVISTDEAKELKSVPAIVDYVFKRKLRDKIINPTIVYNYPAYMIPLARRNDADPRRIDIFQLIVCGAELIKAYSELVNPIQQRAAFDEQAANRAAGDDESFDVDEDYLRAMEHGMPPISGLGMGIDRFMSIVADQPTLRDVILFPIMK